MDGLFGLLPVELQMTVLGQLSPTSLCRAACLCKVAANMTEVVARRRCAAQGITAKAAWCAGSSWRVQCVGRRFNAHGRIRPRQLVTATEGVAHGTRHAVRQRLFGQPSALVALHDFDGGADGGADVPTGRSIVAVCDASRRSIAIIELRSRPDCSRLLGAIAVDGIPCGICVLCSGPGECRVAVSLQGVDEAGNELAGVRDPSHRIVELDLRRRVVCSSRPWRNDGKGMLSYPNGMCLVLVPGGSSLVIACTDWNNQRLLCFAPHEEKHTKLAELRGVLRPADCTMLPASAGGHVLAVADYEGERRVPMKPLGAAARDCWLFHKTHPSSRVAHPNLRRQWNDYHPQPSPCSSPRAAYSHQL
jgi:hypothetical protein